MLMVLATKRDGLETVTGASPRLVQMMPFRHSGPASAVAAVVALAFVPHDHGARWRIVLQQHRESPRCIASRASWSFDPVAAANLYSDFDWYLDKAAGGRSGMARSGRCHAR